MALLCWHQTGMHLATQEWHSQSLGSCCMEPGGESACGRRGLKIGTDTPEIVARHRLPGRKSCLDSRTSNLSFQYMPFSVEQMCKDVQGLNNARIVCRSSSHLMEDGWPAPLLTRPLNCGMGQMAPLLQTSGAMLGLSTRSPGHLTAACWSAAARTALSR